MILVAGHFGSSGSSVLEANGGGFDQAGQISHLELVLPPPFKLAFAVLWPWAFPKVFASPCKSFRVFGGPKIQPSSSHLSFTTRGVVALRTVSDLLHGQYGNCCDSSDIRAKGEGQDACHTLAQ